MAERAVVSVLPVGQGAMNLIEIYDDQDQLVNLSLVDCGCSDYRIKSLETLVKYNKIAHVSILYVVDKMLERKWMGEVALDNLIFTHKDTDHWMLFDFIMYQFQANLPNANIKYRTYTNRETNTISKYEESDDGNMVRSCFMEYIQNSGKLYCGVCTTFETVELGGKCFELFVLQEDENNEWWQKTIIASEHTENEIDEYRDEYKIEICQDCWRILILYIERIENELIEKKLEINVIMNTNNCQIMFELEKQMHFINICCQNGTAWEYLKIVIQSIQSIISMENELQNKLESMKKLALFLNNKVPILVREKIEEELYNIENTDKIIGDVWVGGKEQSNYQVKQLLRRAQMLSKEVHEIEEGMEIGKIRFGNGSISLLVIKKLTINLLEKLEITSIISKTQRNNNATSAVIVLKVNEINYFLFTGDATVHTFFSLLNDQTNKKEYIENAVWTAPHHGAIRTLMQKKDDTDTDCFRKFCQNNPPSSMTISAGPMNLYGHPSKTFIKEVENIMKNIKIEEHYIYRNEGDTVGSDYIMEVSTSNIFTTCAIENMNNIIKNYRKISYNYMNNSNNSIIPFLEYCSCTPYYPMRIENNLNQHYTLSKVIPSKKLFI